MTARTPVAPMSRIRAERKAREMYGPSAYAQSERGKYCMVVVPGLAAGYGGTYAEALVDLADRVKAGGGGQ